MSFLQKYKRLDNLCKDLLDSETGITTYIESMEQCGYQSQKIAGWGDDYRKLKQYRYMRNRIVHENDIDETVLSAKDEIWIEQFYERIINRDDPLARYRRISMGVQQQPKEKKTREIQAVLATESKKNITKKPKRNVKKSKRLSDIIYEAIIICAIVGVICFCAGVVLHIII